MAQENKKGNSISPMILILAGVAIIAVVFLLWPQQKEKKNPKSKNTPKVQISLNNDGQKQANSENIEKIVEDIETQNEITEKLQQYTRNPFSVPGFVQNAFNRDKKANNDRNTPTPTIPVVEPPEKDGPFIEKNKGEDESFKRPLWQGVLGTKNDSVVIIRYKGKTHFLRNGDKLPGTEYRLSSVKNNYVVLNSPTEQIMLEKSKEAKLR